MISNIFVSILRVLTNIFIYITLVNQKKIKLEKKKKKKLFLDFGRETVSLARNVKFFKIFAKNRNIDLESSGLLHDDDKRLYFMCLEGIYKELIFSTVTFTVIVNVRCKSV